ncbi:DUF211 domain-containing protein [Fervidicoccus fontis]|jgi:hypothetical protein|uniref:DUF211 domain-containing protein n=2 Tax=Fervidicoccus fontis TaxID=683846 RepID=H9ZZJ7_FERFK|nr:DUF211 domain-containing protein [Fervidicoccus fontis]AFH42154.1 hypothetical protein FFONT_0162 [Fervidicoccus fontis Kam940]MBE9390907.1 DUF211 domain-containing protein [Fervidicoccus fontis]PMB78011.1 MAG: hypothetical protein C0177_01470 [Fervidicoccus fontis]HEW64436.1 hypothetical protein [Fervidicoccus fontis]
MGILRAVLDVLIPIKGIGIDELSLVLERVRGVEGVNITVKEIDVETESILIVIEGRDIDLKEVERELLNYGGVIHSIDQVISGKKIVEIPEFLYEL